MFERERSTQMTVRPESGALGQAVLKPPAPLHHRFGQVATVTGVWRVFPISVVLALRAGTTDIGRSRLHPVFFLWLVAHFGC